MPDDAVDVLAGLGGIPAALAEAARALALVDHHVHGCFVDPIDRGVFEESFSEASVGPIPGFMTQFDSQPGFAFRRWCAPLLGLEQHAPADRYWAARSILAPAELNRRLLRAARVEHWLLDTGFSSRPITTPAQLAEDARGAASEIVRLEALAESLVRGGVAPRDFPEAFRAALREAAAEAVGLKTILAYRTGFDIDWSVPADDTVVAAARRWTAAGRTSPRLADPVLETFVIHAAVAAGLPLQIHVGFGDRDLDLNRANPMLLLGLLRQQHVRSTPIALLHCYPYHREAGYLAQAFDNVYFDVGLGVSYTGAQSQQLIAESLELAPFAKQLYSSDAFGIPELHLVGSILWRRAMAQVIGRWVTESAWSQADGIRVLRMIGADNAKRVYRL
jgi:predicted TIM-barrel fold metal-dependent hydrolase